MNKLPIAETLPASAVQKLCNVICARALRNILVVLRRRSGHKNKIHPS